jgi:hypothetical protein
LLIARLFRNSDFRAAVTRRGFDGVRAGVGITFVLDHALSMKAIHGGKAKKRQRIGDSRGMCYGIRAKSRFTNV